ncbi:hypothetical protein FXO37_05312 [Capsicum annuum]|nr:hypothetical protein FXO37_05312 [Capsicum annuum]
MERQMSFGGGERKKGKDSPGKRGDSLLHLAVRAGNLGKVREIFQKFEGKGIKKLLCHQNQKGETALYVAAENGNSLVVSEFLKHLDLKTASIVANNEYDALHITARQEIGWHIPKVGTFIICKPLGYIHVKRKSSASLWRAALSMMGTPKLGYLVEIVDECAVLVCLNVVLGLSSVLTEIDDWSRSSPVVMEHCQKTLSCMDCLVAAGVTFCVALQVCLSPKELGLFIMEEIFNESFIVCPKFAFADVVKKISFKDNLIDELSKFSSLSRLCLVRGILTVVSRTVLHIGFVVSNNNFGSVMDSGDSRKSIKMILYDAILPEFCNFCENPIDSHFSFHTLTVMQICLQQVTTSMLNKNGSVNVNYDPISKDMGTRLL